MTSATKAPSVREPSGGPTHTSPASTRIGSWPSRRAFLRSRSTAALRAGKPPRFRLSPLTGGSGSACPCMSFVWRMTTWTKPPVWDGSVQNEWTRHAAPAVATSARSGPARMALVEGPDHAELQRHGVEDLDVVLERVVAREEHFVPDLGAYRPVGVELVVDPERHDDDRRGRDRLLDPFLGQVDGVHEVLAHTIEDDHSEAAREVRRQVLEPELAEPVGERELEPVDRDVRVGDGHVRLTVRAREVAPEGEVRPQHVPIEVDAEL